MPQKLIKLYRKITDHRNYSALLGCAVINLLLSLLMSSSAGVLNIYRLDNNNFATQIGRLEFQSEKNDLLSPATLKLTRFDANAVSQPSELIAYRYLKQWDIKTISTKNQKSSLWFYSIMEHLTGQDVPFVTTVTYHIYPNEQDVTDGKNNVEYANFDPCVQYIDVAGNNQPIITLDNSEFLFIKKLIGLSSVKSLSEYAVYNIIRPVNDMIFTSRKLLHHHGHKPLNKNFAGKKSSFAVMQYVFDEHNDSGNQNDHASKKDPLDKGIENIGFQIETGAPGEAQSGKLFFVFEHHDQWLKDPYNAAKDATDSEDTSTLAHTEKPATTHESPSIKKFSETHKPSVAARIVTLARSHSSPSKGSAQKLRTRVKYSSESSDIPTIQEEHEAKRGTDASEYETPVSHILNLQSAGNNSDGHIYDNPTNSHGNKTSNIQANIQAAAKTVAPEDYSQPKRHPNCTSTSPATTHHEYAVIELASEKQKNKSSPDDYMYMSSAGVPAIQPPRQIKSMTLPSPKAKPAASLTSGTTQQGRPNRTTNNKTAISDHSAFRNIQNSLQKLDLSPTSPHSPLHTPPKTLHFQYPEGSSAPDSTDTSTNITPKRTAPPIADSPSFKQRLLVNKPEDYLEIKAPSPEETEQHKKTLLQPKPAKRTTWKKQLVDMQNKETTLKLNQIKSNISVYDKRSPPQFQEAKLTNYVPAGIASTPQEQEIFTNLCASISLFGGQGNIWFEKDDSLIMIKAGKTPATCYIEIHDSCQQQDNS